MRRHRRTLLYLAVAILLALAGLRLLERERGIHGGGLYVYGQTLSASEFANLKSGLAATMVREGFTPGKRSDRILQPQLASFSKAYATGKVDVTLVGDNGRNHKVILVSGLESVGPLIFDDPVRRECERIGECLIVWMTDAKFLDRESAEGHQQDALPAVTNAELQLEAGTPQMRANEQLQNAGARLLLYGGSVRGNNNVRLAKVFRLGDRDLACIYVPDVERNDWKVERTVEYLKR